ncbi:PAP2 superfamily protein [Agrobacterium vitis]|nr:PAP2 superfamily protein [Agrobacterium vitis]
MIFRAKPRFLLIALIATSYALMVPLSLATAVTIDVYQWLLSLSPFLLSCLTLAAFARHKRYLRISSIAECFLFGVLLGLPILFSTYAAMKLDRPLADAWLHQIDQAMGLDWWGFIRMVDHHPLLAWSLGIAYQSFGFQLMGIAMVLCAVGQKDRGYTMILCFGVIGYCASLIAIWFPAQSAYVTYQLANHPPLHINTSLGYGFLEQFHAVRSQSTFMLETSKAAGILTFPSVHAACAVLYSWGAWSIKPARYPILGLNMMMAVSAMSHGSHYFIDIPAGFMLAACVIAVVSAATASSLNPAQPALQNDAYLQRHKRRADQAQCDQTGRASHPELQPALIAIETAPAHSKAG